MPVLAMPTMLARNCLPRRCMDIRRGAWELTVFAPALLSRKFARAALAAMAQPASCVLPRGTGPGGYLCSGAWQGSIRERAKRRGSTRPATSPAGWGSARAPARGRLRALHGNLPWDRRGRGWPEPAVEALEPAHASVLEGRAASVEQALRAPGGAGDGPQGSAEAPALRPGGCGRRSYRAGSRAAEAAGCRRGYEQAHGRS